MSNLIDPLTPAFARDYTFHEDPNGMGREHYSAQEGISTLLYLIAHAPEIPQDYLTYEQRRYAYSAPEKPVTGYQPIPPAERQARWRLEYALEQIRVVNAATKNTEKP